ncbi:MAG TPA: protein-methionine-sulfoxide reductase heme-binding subunit MsrQ [Terriglobia bacterium]|nr:protein-methionine-sulfoxide reductase heme-binding subunit MsrQ [Terriglobia bacterium]
MARFNRWWIFKPVVFLLCLVPMAWLLWDTFTGNLSANPVEDIRNRTGIWTLRFLMITLGVTPVRRLAGWPSLIRFRRMLGLFAFFYAFVHFITYIWLDQAFAWDEILKDVTTTRPFIISGLASFILLIPLAITSTRKWIGRLGGKRWQMIHRLIYLSAVVGVLHYYWRVKLDVSRPLAYGAVLVVLLGFRLAAAAVYDRRPVSVQRAPLR